MKHRQSGMLFYLFCAVAVVGAILLARSRLTKDSRAASSDAESSMTVTLTDTLATALLKSAMPENFPVISPEVRFSGNEIEISGTAVTETILSGTTVSAYPELDSVRRILPETVFFRASFRADTKGGTLQLTPVEFQLGEFRIPLGFLPSSVRQTLGCMMEQQIDRVGFQITDIRVSDGQLTVSAKQFG